MNFYAGKTGLTARAQAHYGKLCVLGGGLVVLPAAFEWHTGSPPATEPWIAGALLAGCVIYGVGLLFWKKAIEGY